MVSAALAVGLRLRSAGGLPRELTFLVGSNGQDAHARLLRGDVDRRVLRRQARVAIPIFVQHSPEKLEVPTDAVACERAVLADAACKRDRVEAAHHGSVGADVLAYAVCVNRNGPAAVLVAIGGASLDGREVAGTA